MKIIKSQKGFSVLEIILAAAFFVIFSSGVVAVVLQGFQSNRLAEEETIANQYAAEGIEAVRSIRNQSYSNLINLSGTGVAASTSGVWKFSGANNQFGPNNKYTRVITVSSVQRDGSGNIVASGGTVDSDTKKIVSTVSWSASPTRTNSVVLNTYLTNFKKAAIGNWAVPSQQSTIDLLGNGNGEKVYIQGNYAYVVRKVGSPNFNIIDLSNISTPSIVGSFNFNNTPTNIFVSGDYAYISSGDNAGELQIVNVSNPAAPFVIGTFDAAGNDNANAVYVVGTTAYLVRDNGANPEFYVINVSNPAIPVSYGSLNLNGNEMGVIVIGSYAYIASANNGSELIVVNISNPSSPLQVGSLNLTGNQDAISITGFSNTILMGRVGGEVTAFNVTTPASPLILSTFNVGGDVNDMSLGNSNNYLFLATTNSTAEFQVLDVSNLNAITLVGTLNMSASQNGVYYSSTLDCAILVGNANNPEVSIIRPN